MNLCFTKLPSAHGDKEGFENRSRHKHGSLWVIAPGQKRQLMIKCGIRKILLLTTLLFLGLYVWFLGRVLTTSETISIGTILAPTLIFIFPIYVALFQVKTLKIKDGLLTVFYPFRLWSKTYDLREIEKWKYRKTTKTLRFEIYLRSRYVTIKFKDKSWLTVLFSWGLTNFDDLLDYFNERHKELRTNKIFD